MATDTKTATKTAAKPKEDPRAKFVRLVNLRANKVLGSVETLGKLSSGNYEYTPQDVAAVFAPLRQALDAAEAKFRQPTKRSKRESVTFI